MTEEPYEGYKEFLESISKELPKRKYMYKKSEVFNNDYYRENPDKIPDWLADEFDIVWIKYSDLIPKGMDALLPYDKFVNPLFHVETEGKCNEVILWKHYEEGCVDIDLRPPLFSIDGSLIGQITRREKND